METKSDNRNSDMSELVHNHAGTTILFFLSFLPVLYAVYRGFTGCYFGFGQGGGWFYGLDAIFITLFAESMLLFLPVWCLVFQIISGLKLFKTHPRIKHATWILIGVIALSVIACSVFVESRTVTNPSPESYFCKHTEDIISDINS